MSEIPMYDTEYIHPLEISCDKDLTEAIHHLNIPSSRYFYYSNSKIEIPHPACNQINKDICAWQQNDSIGQVWKKTSQLSVSPDVDIIAIKQGITITDIKYDKFDEFYNILTSMGFELEITRGLILDLISFPPNPSADIIHASKLARRRDLDAINKYLNVIGVKHFTAESIINLSNYDIFFCLSRFYGKPVSGDLNANSIKMKYYKLSSNDMAKRISSDLYDNIPVYDKYTRIFDKYFNLVVKDPHGEWYHELGANNLNRFYDSFFDYITLAGRPNDLPALNLKSVQMLHDDKGKSIKKMLKYYTDDEIRQLVGDVIDSSKSRSELIEIGVKKLLENKIHLVPSENKLYVGCGNVLKGLRFYDINEIYDTFEKTKLYDGKYTFHEPDFTKRMSRKELNEIMEVLKKSSIDVGVIDKLQFYINVARAQDDKILSMIKSFKDFIEVSEENENNVRDLFLRFFECGMYLESKGYEMIEKLNNSLNSIPETQRKVFWDLPLICDNMYVDSTIFNNYIDLVNKRYCVKMISPMWMYTSAFFIKNILEEDFPGYEFIEEIN